MIFKDPWVKWSLISAMLGISFALLLPFITPVVKSPPFNGEKCKVLIRFNDIKCGEMKFTLSQVTLVGITSDELHAGDTLNCFPGENAKPLCYLPTEAPT